MRQSELFTKTRKTAPKDEVAKNAQLLIRAGYIHKEMAGVYSFLPLGLRVLNKINDIVREEMNAVGGQELTMSVLQNKELWEKTGRWSDEVVDNWFKTQLKNGADTSLAFTAEEPITNIMRDYLNSYADLPKLAYQIQWKYRNEERAKSGIMRGREFLMKDMYSFAGSADEHEKVYEKVAEAYVKIFQRLGIGDRTYRTFASGGVFSKYSHEFQCLSPIGEDTIYVHEGKKIAINKEVLLPEVLGDLGVTQEELVEQKAIEVGNIFSLGTRFSDALGLKFKQKDGSEAAPVMGCYGIGTSRLLGALVEVFADEKGIVWPESVAPFSAHLVAISSGNEDVIKEADRLYELLKDSGIDVLYDDRDVRAGEKFADSDLIGIPTRLVVSEKTMSEGGIERVDRQSGSTGFVQDSEVVQQLQK
ncbi:MAG: His/Gly/Thr/Pro-type tRNA ligase C-terminal domain-containing protein [Candidatus Pacebacteria bacterium]|nr:His/Gly/Thr/Pro-type tRNA ligase C-terminal domain-containing protein [Candidatus Paceibacterota bacterium]